MEWENVVKWWDHHGVVWAWEGFWRNGRVGRVKRRGVLEAVWTPLSKNRIKNHTVSLLLSLGIDFSSHQTLPVLELE